MRYGTFSKFDQSETANNQGVDQRAVSALINEVYWLALRMLWHPRDAEQATSAIVLRVLDEPGTIPGDARLRSRVLRAAVKYLLAVHKSLFERQAWTFESLADDLERGADEAVPAPAPAAQTRSLALELQVGCTQTMLLCLEREERLIYLLGDVFPLDHETTARAMGLGSEVFRERLELARDRVEAFMRRRCGILNPDRPCRCSHRLGKALRTGRVDSRRLLFVLPHLPEGTSDAERPRSDPSLVFREQHLKPAPVEILDGLSSLIRAKLSVTRLDATNRVSSTRGKLQGGRLASVGFRSLSLSLSTDVRGVKARN